MTFRQPARWPVFAMLVITLIAVGAAVAAWLRPLPEAKTPSTPLVPTFTDQQVADAKAQVCDAYRLADKAVVINTHRTNPVPGDEIGSLATGVSSDFSLYASGDYLVDTARDEPATPSELAKAIDSFGKTLKEIAMNDLAGEPGAVRDPLRRTVDAESATIKGLCQ
jgi:hypothetical protein